MSYEFIDAHIPKSPIAGTSRSYVRRPGYIRAKSHIYVHSTANLKSSAMDERNWLLNKSNTRSASWHEAIDQDEVVQAIPLNEAAYGTLSSSANFSGIHLELCESGDREDVFKNGIERIADIAIEFNWNTIKNHIRQHADVQPKDCPRILRDTNRWDWFVSSCELRLSEKLKNSETNTIIQGLKNKCYISDPTYWRNVIDGGIEVNIEYLKYVLMKFCNLQITDIEGIVKKLVEKKVVTGVAYWVGALNGKIKINPEYLRTLLYRIAMYK